MTTSDTLLRRVCGWCGRSLGAKPGLGQTGVSTGMCGPCFDAMEAEDGPPEDAELTRILDGIAAEVEEVDLSRFRALLPITVEDEQA